MTSQIFIHRRTRTRTGIALLTLLTVAALMAGCAAPVPTAVPAGPLPPVSIVLGSNLGHLPILVGAEKGFFAAHGLDLKLKVVNNGSEMVSAMQKREVELGDMSVTTFIKARHEGDALQVVGLVMNDATRSNADEPLAIISKKGSGIRPGVIGDLKGRKVAVMLGQTPHEYLKIAAARAGLGENDIVIVNMPQSPAIADALRDGTVDAVASLEPLNSLVLRSVADSYEVKRGGGYLSYLMITTAYLPTIQDQAAVIDRFAAGLAEAMQYTRQHRAEAVQIFARAVPGQDVRALTQGINHVSYDPRMSAATDRAFDAAQTDVLSQGSLKGRAPMPLDALLYRRAIDKARADYPQYFSDLPALP
ncbi:MAG: ABC transporter substrate-binding protein [Comamonadaceae bacterium]|nr:MAG: ABC transporter substrate-binding protein [Comamonadaceae bacterium]